jgi:hypothetical protein
MSMSPAKGLPTLAVLFLAGCWVYTIPGEYEAPIDAHYHVPEKASTECISAAKRATRWCAGQSKDVWSDQLYATNCNEARWDYTRYCR